MKLEEATKLALNRDLVRARHVNTRNKRANTSKDAEATPLSINTLDSNVLEQDPVLYNNSIIQQLLSLNSSSCPKQSNSSQESSLLPSSLSTDANNINRNDNKSSKKKKRLSNGSDAKETALFTLKPSGIEFNSLDAQWHGQYEDNFDSNPDSERKEYNEDGEEITPGPIVIPS